MSYFGGGMAAAINGFYRGRDEETTRQNVAEDRETARQNMAEDREYRRTQRGVQQKQQARQDEAWQREDQLRIDNAAIPSTQTTTLTPAQGTTAPGGANFGSDLGDSDGAGPGMRSASKTTQVPMDRQLRQQAENFRKAGDRKSWLDTTLKADELQMGRATQRFAQLESASAGKSTMDVANMAKQIFDEDPFPQKVRSVKDDGAGGVTVEIEDTDSGNVISQSYKRPEDILAALRGLYNPKGFAALQQLRQAAAIKAAEKAAEPMKVSPGQTVLQGGKVVFTAPGVPGAVPLYNDDGAIIGWNKSAPVGGAGSGAGSGSGAKGAGKTPKESLDITRDLLKTALPKEDAALFTTANRYAETLLQANPNLPPATAADIARDAAQNPASVMAALNAQTGEIEDTYSNPKVVRGKFALGTSPSIEEMEARPNGKAHLRAQVEQMFKAQPPAAQALIKDAAASPEALAGRLEDIQSRATSPEQAQAVADMLTRKVELYKRYVQDKKESGLRDRADDMSRPGSIQTASKYAGMTGKDLSQRVQDDARTSVSANANQSIRNDAARRGAEIDPELQALQAQKARLLQQGKAVEANNAISEFRRLRQEKYGF